jgi:sulfide:quinone oxidoreductase
MAASSPLRVVVAGGGFAAGEALLALRELAGDLVDLTLVTPDRRLMFRPQATSAVFGTGRVATFDLADLAADAGATVQQDALRSVAPAAGRINLTSGGALGYDALILAVGARARIGVPGALTFRDQRDVALAANVVDDLRSGAIRRVAFTAPAASRGRCRSTSWRSTPRASSTRRRSPPRSSSSRPRPRRSRSSAGSARRR